MTLAARLLAVLATLLTGTAAATEGGTTSFPNGGEDFLVAAMPPPGVYSIVYATRYSADRLAGPLGDAALERFSLRVNALTPRLDWVKPVSVLGADRWGTLIVLPYLDIDLALSPAPGVDLAASRKGIGDLTVGNGLHWTLGNFHMVNALDIVAPTGRFSASRLVNTGRHQWAVRTNHMGTWLAGGWDFSYRLHHDYNFENRSTRYRSGQTIYLNYALGWKPDAATTVGITGFALSQVTDDRGPEAPPGGNRLRARGIGPAVKRFFPGGVFVTAKYLHEHDARNGPRGHQFWIYAGFPLGGP